MYRPWGGIFEKKEPPPLPSSSLAEKPRASLLSSPLLVSPMPSRWLSNPRPLEVLPLTTSGFHPVKCWRLRHCRLVSLPRSILGLLFKRHFAFSHGGILSRLAEGVFGSPIIRFVGLDVLPAHLLKALVI